MVPPAYPASARAAQGLTALLCLLQGGYLVLDGSRALVVGRYITPSSGEHAGQLGPWASVVATVGVDPHATGMKVTFVVLGLCWLAVAAGVVAGARWARAAGLTAAVASLWYLVTGTVVAVAVLALLLSAPPRQALGRR